jgi:hypothetical protein
MLLFTFDQKLGRDHSQQSIQQKGLKGIFLKTLDIKERKISAIACCDGKGGVTLGISTVEQTRHWDLVLENSLDNRA